MLETAFWLLVGHAVGDFALQSDWMVKYKSQKNTDVQVLSNRPGLIWVHVLGAHCMVHAGAVALATGSVLLGLFELIAHRYERHSLIITSNQDFEHWDKLFEDTIMTVAAIDRLVHHATILQCTGESYRRKASLKKQTT